MCLLLKKILMFIALLGKVTLCATPNPGTKHPYDNVELHHDRHTTFRPMVVYIVYFCTYHSTDREKTSLVTTVVTNTDLFRIVYIRLHHAKLLKKEIFHLQYELLVH